MDGKLSPMLFLACIIVAQLCMTRGSNAKSVDLVTNITISGLSSVQSSIDIKDPLECKIYTHQQQSSFSCLNSIGEFLTNSLINLSYDNPKLSDSCKYQLECELPDTCTSDTNTGELCKACKTNYSRIFTSNDCRECSNYYLFLLVPFAVAGPVLILFLIKCNLTVSTGQVNAIIFYSNVLHVIRGIQFKEFQREFTFFSVFIAWINLDLGIKTCFYNGMDAYSRVWLQFVFPAYLWLLVAILYILSKLFSPLRTFLGGNCLPSLSVTIIILTYSKLLQTIKSALSFTWANRTDTTVREALWFEDDTVQYLGPRHTILFTAAILVIILYMFPVMLIGVFAPCIQAYSNRKALRWVRKLKPFLDAYQVPYNDNFRYWTGLMLVLRILLYLLFGINKYEDPPMYYFLIVLIVGPIAVFVAVKQNKTVYRRAFSNILEAITLLNLTVLNLVSWFLTTYEETKRNEYKQYVTYVSISITMLLFLVVLLHQSSLVLCPQVYLRCQKKRLYNEELEESSDGEDVEVEVIRTNQEFDQSQKAYLREPLIESSASPTPQSTAILY